MHGYVARKRDRYYAVIYEGLDPITGRERRSWHPAGTDRDEAERLAARLQRATISINRGLVAIGYELHESRGKTDNSRRRIDLDPTTVRVLRGWRALQAVEYDAVGIDDPGWVFADAEGRQVHPHALSQTFERIVRRAGVPVIRLHDLRHTHGTLLIKDGVPVKVVSERLGHANIAFTIETYQHVLPGMQRDAARTFEAIVAPSVRTKHRPGGSSRWNTRENAAPTR
jgi:integrase